MTTLLAVVLLAGCTPAYKPNIHLKETIVLPATAVVLITVDGLAEPTMDEMLAAGELPNIAKLIDGGARVSRAVSALPSLTYPNLTTILTGCMPSSHGIMGNRWFDRYSLTHRDYATVRTYRDADGDIMVPTVYEHLGDAFTVSIQCAIRRGADRTIDNWASSGIRWFFGAYEATDQLIPWRFDLIAQEANRRGHWPVLIHAYFPGTDEIGHRYGSDSPEYRRCLANVDRQIGLIAQALATAGMADRTCTILVADHNHTPVSPDHWFDVPAWLADAGPWSVRTAPLPGRQLADRAKSYQAVDAVVVMGGDRIARISIRGPGGWHMRPTRTQIDRLLTRGTHWLVDQEAIGLIAVRRDTAEGRRVVDLYSHLGQAELERRHTDGTKLYRYTVAERGPLDFGDGTDVSLIEDAGWHDADAWLAATGGGDYPGLVAQLADMFDSPRAGDVVLFAAEGWDFRPGNRGGHGGAGACDTRVPMVFSGPMIDRSANIDVARLTDVTPTILGLLGVHPIGGAEAMDGADLSDRLRGPEPYRQVDEQ